MEIKMYNYIQINGPVVANKLYLIYFHVCFSINNKILMIFAYWNTNSLTFI